MVLQKNKKSVVYFLATILIIGFSIYFRFSGLNWDDRFFLHPDERFLVQVADKSQLPDNLTEWFDSSTSKMNPQNQGFDFYVYGTFPLLIVKTVQALFAGTSLMSSSEFLLLAGRFLSAFFDLLTLLLIAVFSWKIWRKQEAVLLTMAAYGFMVGAIQQSHYFTVDSFSTFFSIGSLIFLFDVNHQVRSQKQRIPIWMLSGFLLGLAMACKISAAFFFIFPLAAVFLMHLKDKKRFLKESLLLVLFTASSLAAFRLFQPYAFENSNLLDFRLSADWISSMKELAGQSAGLVDFPPAWQWVGRSPFYAIGNLAIYGLGLPLFLMLCVSLILTLKAQFRNMNRIWLVLFLGSVLFIGWQTLQFSKMMRYLLPICPVWMIMLGGLFSDELLHNLKIRRWANYGIVLALGMTFFWACAFTHIYRTPHTRIQASRWIYDTISAPITIHTTTTDNQAGADIPIPVRSYLELTSLQPQQVIPLNLETGDHLRLIEWGKIENLSAGSCSLVVSACEDAACSGIFAESTSALIDSPRILFPEDNGIPQADVWMSLALSGEDCKIRIGGESFVYLLRNGQPRYLTINGLTQRVSAASTFEFDFQAKNDGSISSLSFHESNFGDQNPTELQLDILDYDSGQTIRNDLIIQNSHEESPLRLSLPLKIEAGNMYKMIITPNDPQQYGTFSDRKIAVESTWDEALPMQTDGNQPFDPVYGRYGSLINLDLLMPQDLLSREKLFARISNADVFVISSNRIYGAVSQAPQNFPLTDAFYRYLISCPNEKTLSECFQQLNVENQIQNQDFVLSAVFESEPEILDWHFSTQQAEEAFTVYDHPKVFVFLRTPGSDLFTLRNALDSVDLNVVSNKTPLEYTKMDKITPMLTEAEQMIQQSGGTWSELFPRSALINSNEFLTVILWFGLIWLIGILFLPISHLVFGSLRDRGYGVSRFFGLLLAGFVIWRISFSAATYSPATITVVFLCFLLLNLLIFFLRKQQFLADFRAARKYIIQSEIVFLACFVFFLLIRLGNPDLWHPYKGGEKPMDFSYFNAILKSTQFPPYDPWFGGGSLNYYYYGHYLSGMLVKWIGLNPSVAYNLILPTWYAFLGVGAFTLGSNLISHIRKDSSASEKGPLAAGAFSVLLMQVFGNLGTVKDIAVATTQLGCPAISEQGAGLEKIGCFFAGIGKIFQGQHFPMAPGNWYWQPSRAIPGESITEFPFFTFLYGDPHAHLFALPITVMVLVWLTSLLMRKTRPNNFQQVITLLSGSLIIGSLFPTNTWDMPTYLLISCVVLIGLGLREPFFDFTRFMPKTNRFWIKILQSLVVIFLLSGAVVLMFAPFFETSSREAAIDIWQGSRTPLWSYLMHWGLFLFALIGWYYVETIDWLASLRMSDFRRFNQKYKTLISVFIILVLSVLVYSSAQGVWIAWIAIPLMVWSLCLMFKKELPDSTRFLLFLAGTALFITLFVEFFSLRGDLGRMNMVFKFYLQAWVLLSPVAAFAIVSVVRKRLIRNDETLNTWKKQTWKVAFGLLLIGAGSYTIFASADKITDRMSDLAPHTLDGMKYMETSSYFQDGFVMDLSQDYEAIQWIQDNVQGSPVIVEGNPTEYKWGNRFTVYTGLPGVIGWNYHQRQQRGAMSDQVWQRVNDVTAFYNDPSVEAAAEFLRTYHVRFIIVGQMEKGMFAPEGIEKFESANGFYWNRVYQSRDTAIYEVVE